MRGWKLTAVIGLCVLLSGCGGEEASLLSRAAEIEESAVLLTVDGRETPAWRYLCWLAFTCGEVRERYEEAGLTLDWSTPVSGGSLGEYAKEQALSDAALYATVENWAEDWGCALTEEEREALTSDPETEALWCVSEVQGRELAEVGALYAKLCERYINGEAPLPIALPEGLFLDRILVSNDRENARETIETLFSELNGAEDQQAVFTSLAAAWDDPAGPRQVSPGDWPAPLEEAAQALEPGQISGILASEEGYSILRRLPDQTPANGTPEAFDALLQAAAEQAKVTLEPAYARLNAAAFQERLDSLRAEEGSSR